MASTQDLSPRRGRSFTPEDRQRGLEAARAKRQAAETAQREQTLTVGSYTLRPAIGLTGGVANEGWELIPPSNQGPEWYLGTKAEALAAVDRHQARYSRRAPALAG